jgi:L-threonylcarbamoyladenylate synthase
VNTTIGTDIGYAAELLRSGEVVGVPTETVYGLAANALSADAVIKIFEAKNRPFFDPLIVHIKDVSEAEKYVQEIPVWALQLAEKFSPGPITFLLRKKDIIPDIVTSGLERVGIRIPAHPTIQALLEESARLQHSMFTTNSRIEYHIFWMGAHAVLVLNRLS